MFRDDDIYIAKEIVDNVDITDKPSNNLTDVCGDLNRKGYK